MPSTKLPRRPAPSGLAYPLNLPGLWTTVPGALTKSCHRTVPSTGPGGRSIPPHPWVVDDDPLCHQPSLTAGHFFNQGRSWITRYLLSTLRRELRSLVPSNQPHRRTVPGPSLAGVFNGARLADDGDADLAGIG